MNGSLSNNIIIITLFVELLKVETSDQYEKELWQLNIEERLKLIPELKEKGNKLYAEKQYNDAEEAYRQALGILEQLMIR